MQCYFTLLYLYILGLEVVAVICDQGSTNRAAIEGLVQEARASYLKVGETPKRRVLIGNTEIVPIYDVPHLFKGMRNNLMTYKLVWHTASGTVVAKWEHIICAYQIDSASGDIRLMPKITEFHVAKDKMKKMKVSCATQIFSHTVAAAIAVMARNSEFKFKRFLPIDFSLILIYLCTSGVENE